MSRLFEALSKIKVERGENRTIPSDLAHVVESLSVPSLGVPEAAPVETEETRSVSVHPGPTSRLVAVENPKSLGGEKFRALVTRLDHLRKQHEFKSLQITSSVPGEGKTLVAANLAVTLAKYLGSRTLLVEGDLHRPTIASLFGLPQLQGLSHWWSGRDKGLSRFLYRLNGLPLWILPGGKAEDQPSAVLKSARFTEAFAQISGQFEWIVVDSTPMLPIVDANLWSRLVDGTLLVVREGVTPVKALKNGLQALDHPNLIGVVMNEALECDEANYEGYYQGPSRSEKHSKKEVSSRINL